MATRDQVLSLFGATPQQILERQRRSNAEFMAAQRDPFGQAGAAIGLGLARAFGKPSQEMQMAEQMQAAVAGVDPNDPEALRQLAKTVSSFAPERALQIAAYAGELEKSQMPSTVDVPAIVGYETEPDIDPVSGLQRVDADKKPLFKRNPIFRNVPFERTPEGLRSLVPGYSLPKGSSTAVKDQPDATTPEAPVPDYITNEQGVVVRNPAKTGEATATTTTQATPAATAQPAPTQEPFVPQQGRIITDPAEIARLEQSLLTPGAQAAPRIAQPLPKGEIEYADPEALQEASDALRDQIVKLEKSNDKNKEAKLKILRKRRAEIQKQRIASRRRGVPADLQATGQVSDVFSGFRNVK